MKKRRRKARNRLVSELNITNLVDVTFALLIIFMITAPLMTQGVQVDLPKTESENVEVNKFIQISINELNEIYLDQRKVSLFEFKKEFNAVFSGRKEVPVFINADKKVPYGLVIRVISDVQNVGAEKLGFLTQPLDRGSG